MFTLQPVQTRRTEQSCFRSDITETVLADFCQIEHAVAAMRCTAVCVCPSSIAETSLRHLVTQQEEASYKLCILCCVLSSGFCYILWNRGSWIQPSLHFPIFHGTWCQFLPYSVMTLSHTHPRFHNPCLHPLPMDFIFTIWNLSSNWNLFHT